MALSLIARTYCDVWMIHNGTAIERWNPNVSDTYTLVDPGGPGPPLFLDQTEAQRQTCQLSRFCRECHDFLSFLMVSRQGSSISWVLGKIILKWFKLLNQNKNGKLTRNACAIKWKTNKEEHCSYFFVPSCDFRLCSINLIVFLRVCPPFWKGSRPWERGLIPRRLPCWVSQ